MMKWVSQPRRLNTDYHAVIRFTYKKGFYHEGNGKLLPLEGL